MTKKKRKQLNATSLRVPCLECEGTGYIELKSGMALCWTCDGTGKVFIDRE